MNLLIGIPSNRDWKRNFSMSLMELCLILQSRNSGAYIQPYFSSCLSESRQYLLDKAIKDGYSHLLFIDDDMLFNLTAFNLLASRNKDFVVPNIALRDREPIMTNTVGTDGNNLKSSGKTGIERISLTGLAFSLIKIDAVKNIPKPHFEVRWSEKLDRYFHEDEFFCELLRNNGIELYVDHDASRHVWHIGTQLQQEKF